MITSQVKPMKKPSTKIDHKTEAETLRKQVEELTEGWQRAHAELENFRKRTELEKAELRKYANEDLIFQILPVLDNFRRATEHVPAAQKDSDWVIGIQYIEKQLESVLNNSGLEKLETKVGDKFDPNVHEAIEGEAGGEIINEVVSEGYKLNDRVIRCARVKVK